MLNETPGDKWIGIVHGDKVAVNKDFIPDDSQGMTVTEHPSMVTHTTTTSPVNYTLTVTPGVPTYIDGTVEYNINIT